MLHFLVLFYTVVSDESDSGDVDDIGLPVDDSTNVDSDEAASSSSESEDEKPVKKKKKQGRAIFRNTGTLLSHIHCHWYSCCSCTILLCTGQIDVCTPPPGQSSTVIRLRIFIKVWHNGLRHYNENLAY